ncbi:MAG: Fis family transcriptional regulator [Hydrococcus sp. SU_1_0]|nr:Fis family transcriptional regulator [Hydrococcus sp. SU_1_0]
MRSKFEDFEDDQAIVNFNVSLNQEMEFPTDSFELISAYLDGELSPAERHQVQKQIDQDPQIKTIYNKLLVLQSQIQGLEAPPQQRTVGEITEQVFQSLDHRRRQRQLVLGGSAIAASCLVAMTGLISGMMPTGFRLAQSPSSSKIEFNEIEPNNVMLAVALNKPAINIPKLVNGYTIEQPPSLRNKI